MSDNNLKDIFSYKSFARFEKEGHLDKYELEKLESLILIMQNTADLREGIRTEFSQTELSQNKYYILLLLNEKEEELLTPSKIADFLNLSRGTVSDLIDSMDKDGFLERVICKNDRRKIQVIITQKGRQVIEEIIPKYYRYTSELMSCLNGEEVKSFLEITNKLKANMKKIKGATKDI
ncbi:MAG: MarR family winged helix-turn-helix transcriptional regulator [Aminipila sp.]